MTVLTAQQTLASAFLHDFQCRDCGATVRYIAPDGSFQVSVTRKSCYGYQVDIERFKGMRPSLPLLNRAKNFVALMQ